MPRRPDATAAALLAATTGSPRPGSRMAGGPTDTPAMRRAEQTNRIAREMIDQATVARHAKVEKLKAARLAREAEAEPPPPPPAKKPAAKRAKKA